MSGLTILLKHEMNKQNLGLRDLASLSKLAPSTLSKIMNTSNHTPDLKTLAAISSALQLPLGRLIEACGYAVDSVGNPDDVQRQIAAIAGAVPELREMFLDLAHSNDDVRRSVLAYMKLLDQERQAS